MSLTKKHHSETRQGKQQARIKRKKITTATEYKNEIEIHEVEKRATFQMCHNRNDNKKTFFCY